ncbi:uncharacterized protein [Antedon mediterranea]|uniref:uncharacterized protein n=1 Tax=Antedon mediterranea TaxID=105859 RepID=UPI003AF44535
MFPEVVVFLLLAVIVSSAPVEKGWDTSVPEIPMSVDFSTFMEKFQYNVGESIQNQIDTALAGGEFSNGFDVPDQQQVVFGGIEQGGLSFNGFGESDTLPKFSDPNFDWQQYLETAEEGKNGLSPEEATMGQNFGSFDMQKYIDEVNKEMEDLGLNE